MINNQTHEYKRGDQEIESFDTIKQILSERKMINALSAARNLDMFAHGAELHKLFRNESIPARIRDLLSGGIHTLDPETKSMFLEARKQEQRLQRSCLFSATRTKLSTGEAIYGFRSGHRITDVINDSEIEEMVKQQDFSRLASKSSMKDTFKGFYSVIRDDNDIFYILSLDEEKDARDPVNRVVFDHDYGENPAGCLESIKSGLLNSSEGPGSFKFIKPDLEVGKNLSLVVCDPQYKIELINPLTI